MHATSEDVEVDLSISLDTIKPAPPSANPPTPVEADLDGVFGNMRAQSAKRAGLDEAEKEYKRGLALRAAGDLDGCIQALEKASRAPKLRFGTAWLIARLYRDRAMMAETLEWLERASQAPAPTSEERHQLLFELAEALEQVGEVARALAVLHGAPGRGRRSYRDVDAAHRSPHQGPGRGADAAPPVPLRRLLPRGRPAAHRDCRGGRRSGSTTTSR